MKKKSHLSVLVFFLASFAGCISSSPRSLVTNDGSVRIIESPDGPLYICDLKTAGDTVDIPLSELVEDCRIVRFETTDEALFNAWWIEVSDNYICVRQESNVVKLYGKDGKISLLTMSSSTTTLGTKGGSCPEETYGWTRRKCRLPNTAWSTTSTGISRSPTLTAASTRADSFSTSNRPYFRK